ncbi:MAG: aminotransferase class V-fold PLP-dependent enzyme [Clostridium sp.]
MKLFTLGPVEMEDYILEIAGEKLPYFRTPEFSKLELEVVGNLKTLLNAGEGADVAILTSSGTGAMEASVCNVLTEKDKVLIVSGGNFGERFEEICDCYNIEYDSIKLKFPQALTKEMLNPYLGNKYTALLVNLHETATGQLYDIEMLSNFCKEKEMYFIVDSISSFLTDPLDMTKHGVDIVMISSQKGLALHPGLSFVVASERIIRERIKKVHKKFLYFNLENYFHNIKRGQTPYTPAVGILMQVHERLKRVVELGLDESMYKCEELARDFRGRCEDVGIKVPSYPKSNACTPVYFEKGHAMDVYNNLKEKYSIYLTPNGGELSEYILRIGHIGNLTIEDNKYMMEKLSAEYKKYEL